MKAENRSQELARRGGTEDRRQFLRSPPRLCRGKPWSPSAPPAAGKLHASRLPLHSPRFPLSAFRFPAAFTLVEIMVVLFIIMVLSGLIVGAAKYARTKAARSRAEAEIAAMETALESFKVDNGYYPRSGNPRPITTSINTNSYVVFTALAAGPKKYMEFKPAQFHIVPVPGLICTNILDPFGNDYSYYCYPSSPLNDQTNSVTFDLWSYGPDNLNNTADDIVNWKQ